MVIRSLAISLALVGAFLAGTLVPSASSQSKRGRYLKIDYMKIPPGQTLKYRDLELKPWKPIHELRVKQGLINSWKLYGHHLPGGGADYQYVTTTEFATFAAMEDFKYNELFKEAYNVEYDGEMQKRTAETRTLTHSDIWALVAEVN